MALSAYGGELARGSVLSAIAHPTVVDPAGALGRAAQIGGNILDLQKLQSQQAWGNALQQATDPKTGEVNWLAAQRIAAANPAAAMGMADNLRNASNIRSQQLEQGNAAYSNIARSALTLQNDPSDDNVRAVFSDLIRTHPGSTDQITREMNAVLAMTDPKDRVQYAYRHGIAALDAQSAMNRSPFGQTTLTQLGGTTAPTTLVQPSPYGTGGVTVGGGIAHTQDPGTYYAPQPSVIMYDANGQPTTDPTKAVRSVPTVTPRGPVMGAPAPGTVAPAPPTAPLPTGYQPRPNAQPQPSPTPAPRGPNQAPTTSASSSAPTPPPQPPTPTTSPQPPTPAPVITGLPTGTEQAAGTDVAKYQEAQNVLPSQQTNLIAGKAALDALKLARTGPGTSFVNQVKAFAQAQGLDIWRDPQTNTVPTDPTVAYQVARKNLLRFAQGNGSRIGTDLGLATQLESNPNVDQMVNAANDQVLKKDMGVARRNVAATLEAQSGDVGKSRGVGWADHIAKFTNETDPVAFAWDLLTGDERNRHIAEVSKVKGGLDKLDKSLELAAKHGLINIPQQANAQ